MNLPAQQVPESSKLNDEQALALQAMLEFIKGPELFFLLEGYAGTGKTFTLKEFLRQFKGRVIFTAPTNKATRVLRDTLRTETYNPECKTIYSLLGLQMAPNGEVKELVAPEEPIDLTQYKVVVVDEGSMVGTTLWPHIESTAKDFNLKFLFLADFAQLPPVGEKLSPCKKITQGFYLTQVMRYDNQILSFVTGIRNKMSHPAPSIGIVSDNAGDEGVWAVGKTEFMSRILEAAEAGDFSRVNGTKALAWRNVTVDELNRAVRQRIFPLVRDRFVPDDRVILTEPAKNLEEEIIGLTDDEGKIDSVTVTRHPLFPQYKVWSMSVTTDDNKKIRLNALHEDSIADFQGDLNSLSIRAKADKRIWKEFWKLRESMHSVRHAYAITVHRSQGSTYETVFVDYRDILLNRDRGEAFQCLYVACTRPKKRLILA
jgi:exodeoxyribonuclease V